MIERRESRRNQLLDDHQERKGYCKLKEEAIDRILGRTTTDGEMNDEFKSHTANCRKLSKVSCFIF